jgi:hypothetical protein
MLRAGDRKPLTDGEKRLVAALPTPPLLKPPYG